LALSATLPLALFPRGDRSALLAPPAAHAAPHPWAPGDQVLGIDAAGQHYLNGRPIRNGTLGAELRAVSGGAAAATVLYVTAAREVDYAAVAAATSVAFQNGVRIVRLVVAP
jgi:biopolymer transport protein ExbD